MPDMELDFSGVDFDTFSAGREKTKQYEGWDESIYSDTEKIPTIGYGFNLQDPSIASKLPEEVTTGKRPLRREEAEPIFNDRYDTAIDDARQFVGEETFNRLDQSRKDTLVDMSYNLGLPRLSGFKKLRKALQSGDYDRAAEEMKDSNWYKQTGNRAKENIREMEKTKGKLDLSFLSNMLMPSAEAAETSDMELDFSGVDFEPKEEEPEKGPSEIRAYTPSFYEKNIKPFLQTLNIVPTPRIAQKTLDIGYARGAKEPGVIKVGISPQVAGWLDKYEEWTKTPTGKYLTEMDEAGETRAGSDLATAAGVVLIGAMGVAGVQSVMHLLKTNQTSRALFRIGNRMPEIEKILKREGFNLPERMTVHDKTMYLLHLAKDSPTLKKGLGDAAATAHMKFYAGMPIPFKSGDVVRFGKQLGEIVKVTGNTAQSVVAGGEKITAKLSELTAEKPDAPKTKDLPLSFQGKDGIPVVEETKQAYGGFKQYEQNIEKVIDDIGNVHPAGEVQPPKQKRTSRIAESLKGKGYVDYRGHKVENVQDAAEIVATLRNPNIEHLHTVFVKAGKVVAHQVISSGAPHFVRLKSNYYSKITRTAQKLGADVVYTGHNHPGGNPEVSLADIDVFQRLTKTSRKMGVGAQVTYKEIVTDGDKFTVVTDSLETGRLTVTTHKFQEPKEIFPKGAYIKNEDMAAAELKNFMGKGKITVLFRTNSGHLAGIESIHVDKNLHEFIRNNLKKYSATHYIVGYHSPDINLASRLLPEGLLGTISFSPGDLSAYTSGVTPGIVGLSMKEVWPHKPGFSVREPGDPSVPRKTPLEKYEQLPLDRREQLLEKVKTDIDLYELNKTPEGNLHAAIKQLGGIRPYRGKKEMEEHRTIPQKLRSPTGTGLDKIVESLKEYGWHFEDGEELRQALLNATEEAPTNIRALRKFLKIAEKSQKLKEVYTEKIEKHLQRPLPPGKVKPGISKTTGITKPKQPITMEERRLLQLKLQTEAKGAKTGFKEGRREVIRRRAAYIRGVQQEYGLTDAELKRILHNRNFGIMGDFAFKQYIDKVRIDAQKMAERSQAMNELVDQIGEKELNVENLRKAMKLPTFKNMTIEDIHKLDEALQPFQKGDEFLSVRKLEVVDRIIELKGLKTYREVREQLSKELNVPAWKLSRIRVSEFDRFRWDAPLAKRNDFFRMMVEKTTEKMMISNAEYLKIEKDLFALAKKLGYKGFINILVPQQKKIMAFMEAPIAEKAGIGLTKEEIAIADFMTKHFLEAREYLIKIEAMKQGRQNYFTHIRRGILETVKEDGIIQAFKEAFTSYKELEQGFNILDRVTGEILAFDKFFKFAMHRTGEIKPTENVVRAFLTYMRTFKKKQALDELVPLIDIYAHALTPKGLTKTGVMLHGNLVRFVKEWLNTKKGRHVTLVAKQGGKVDGVLRAIKTFTSLRDLALNIPVSIFTELGEQVSTYQLLGKIRFVLGKWRHQTKQGKKIVSEHTAFIGKNPWTELIEPAKDIGDRLMEGIFIMFKDASVRANKTFLLGSLTKKEFNSGIINTKRLAELKTELGRYRTFHGAASILGSTPEGKSYSQYKTWALPILSTTVQNLKNLSVSLLNKSIPLSEKKKSLRELYRIIEVTAFMAIMFNLIADKDEDKNSFAGRMVRKAWDEANTLIHAIQPRMFMAMGRTASFVEELGENLTLIIQGEKYKTTKKLKGLEKLKRQFKPVAISQFQTKKKKEKKEEPMAPGELDFEGLDFDGLDLGAIDIPELDFSGVEF